MIAEVGGLIYDHHALLHKNYSTGFFPDGLLSSYLLH